jgi:hypothetical protein
VENIYPNEKEAEIVGAVAKSLVLKIDLMP